MPVTMEGARDVTVRVLLGEADGAPGFTMRLFELAPGGHTPRHSHAHEHEIIVLGGSGTLQAAQGEHSLAPGTVALVEPHDEHQFRAGEQGMRIICLVPHAGHG
jgi:quercetin dioxygenase-like cupin family protein